MKLKPTVQAVPSGKAGSDACLFGAEWLTLSWTAGLLSAFLHLYWAAVIAGLAGGAVLLRLHQRKAMLCLLCGLCLGTGAWTLYDLRVRQPLLAMDGQTVTCTGTVLRVRRMDNDTACYTLSTKLQGIAAETDWYADSAVPLLQTGDTVTLSAELSRIADDYRYRTAATQAGHGRYLRIYRAKVLEIHRDTGISLRRLIQRYRETMTEELRIALPEADAGLYCAMLFGDKSALENETAATLYQTGIGHITAVSGLHLVLFCMALSWLFRLLRLPPRGQFLLLLPAIALFILLVDSSVSVYRAALMLCISRSAALFGRRGDTLRSLCITMFACTVLTPYVIGAASFWLSVSGVFGIGVAAPYLRAQTGFGGLRGALLELCCVSAAVFPASVLLTGETSLLAPVSNLLLLPLATAALFIGFSVLLTGGLTAFLLPVGGALCRMTRLLAEGFARLPFSHLTVTSAAVRAAIAVLGGMFLLLLALRVPLKRLAAAAVAGTLLLSGLTAYTRIRNAQELQIAVLGNSRAAVLVISAEGCTAAVDLSENAHNPEYVRRYLTDCGCSELHLLICSGRTSAAYQKALSSVKVSQVIMTDAVQQRADDTVCGVKPVYVQNGSVSVRIGALQMDRNADLTLTWNGQRVIVCPAATASAQQADAVIRWGGVPAVRDDCRMVLNPAGASAENIVLCVTKSRRFFVKKL